MESSADENGFASLERCTHVLAQSLDSSTDENGVARWKAAYKCSQSLDSLADENGVAL
jgi:hypothetical protein